MSFHAAINIKEKSVLVILAVLLTLSLAPLPAEESVTSGNKSHKKFSFSAGAGILYGRSEEIVYKSPESDLYSSELLWDLRPLVYTGVAADFGPHDPFSQNGLAAAFSFRFGLPLKTGIIEDRDWLNNNDNYMTHYSRHDAYSRRAILSGISFGYSWTLARFLALKAYGNFSYMNFSWSAEDGYIQYPSGNSSGSYPPWNNGLPKDYGLSEGTLILYTQNWFILDPGISLAGRFGRFFSVEGNFNYSPLVFCFGKDDHLKRGTVFRDYLYFGHYLKGSCALVFSTGKNIDLSLYVSYTHITGTRGDTYAENTLYANSAGAAYRALDAGLAVKYFTGQKPAE